MMVKVKNLGSKVFLPTGEWLMPGETLEVIEPVAVLLQATHKIEIITEKKKKK